VGQGIKEEKISQYETKTKSVEVWDFGGVKFIEG
jgi:hypothetical protein